MRLPKDALKRDNLFHFVVSPSEPVHAFVIDRAGAEREALYLTRALAISESPRVELTLRGRRHRVRRRRARRPSVVILNDVQVADELADRLTRFVASGGGLFIAAGPHATWPCACRRAVPALPGDVVDRTTHRRRGSAVSNSAIPYSSCSARRAAATSRPRASMATAPPRRPTGPVLARFDDGTPGVDRAEGRARRVLLWTSTLDLEWNDMAVKPVFLPFVHTVTKYLADYADAPASLTVGQVIPAPKRGAGRGAAVSRGGTVAVAPSGARVSVETEDGALELDEQGFYDVRTQGAGADSATVLASNVDLTESDLTPMDPRELLAAVAGRGPSGPAGLGDARPTADAQAQAQRLWWYLLVAGVLLLAGETLLANRLSGERAQRSV